jgi:hypothetical protein
VLLRGTLILIGLWGISPGPTADKISLHGTAQLCPEEDTKADTAGVRGVHVFAFDLAKAQKIRASLHALDAVDWSSDGVEAMRSFSAEYTKLMTAVKGTPTLGAAVSNGSGDFEITVPRTDSVLLFAEEELEDQPFFFASKVVPTKGQDEVRVILRMCNKQL